MLCPAKGDPTDIGSEPSSYPGRRLKHFNATLNIGKWQGLISPPARSRKAKSGGHSCDPR